MERIKRIIWKESVKRSWLQVAALCQQVSPKPLSFPPISFPLIKTTSHTSINIFIDTKLKLKI